jgi:hypothetical protein
VPLSDYDSGRFSEIMVTPEERIRERERVAIATTAARLPIEEVSWSGIWAGFMTAMAVAVVLTALGIAVGISVLDVNPAGAHDARSWTIGAGLWTFFTYIIALFAGGVVATRTGGYTVRPSGTVVGTAVWVLSLAAMLLFGVIRLALIATPLLRAPFGPADGMPPAIAQADPDLAAALTNGDVDRATGRLADPTTADRIASATGVPRDRVTSTLADIRARLSAERGDPSRAIANVRTGLADVAARAPGGAGAASGVPVPAAPQPAATIVGWVTFFVLIASLGAAIAGAGVGFRSAAIVR